MKGKYAVLYYIFDHRSVDSFTNGNPCQNSSFGEAILLKTNQNMSHNNFVLITSAS